MVSQTINRSGVGGELVFVFALLAFSGRSLQGGEYQSRYHLGPFQPVASKEEGVSEQGEQVGRTAELLTDERQDVRNGLRFVIEIKNDSETPMKIYDPSDVLSFELTDDSGHPVALPPVPSLALINTGDPDGTRARLDRDRPYSIDRLPERALPPGVKAVDDRDEDGYVSLGPGERLRISVRITRVVANPKEYSRERAEFVRNNPQTAPPPPQAVAIPAGSYTLRVYLPLAENDRTSVSLRSESIRIELE